MVFAKRPKSLPLRRDKYDIVVHLSNRAIKRCQIMGKRKLILAGVALALLVGIAGYFLGRSSSPTDTTTTEDAQNMSTKYDLSTDQDGLSKALATLTMENGDVIQIRFYTNDAPNTVKRITSLINEGFYNGIIFHRVVPGFVAQAGDPSGTGSSGSGVKLKAEFNSRKHVRGILSMARTSDPNSADSQFFIMLADHPYLDGQYTIFGKIVNGIEAIDRIKQGDKIKSFTIE